MRLFFKAFPWFPSIAFYLFLNTRIYKRYKSIASQHKHYWTEG